MRFSLRMPNPGSKTPATRFVLDAGVHRMPGTRRRFDVGRFGIFRYCGAGTPASACSSNPRAATASGPAASTGFFSSGSIRRSKNLPSP